MWPGFLLLVLLGLGEALFFFFGTLTLTLTFKFFIVGLILRVELRGLAIYFFLQ